MSDISSGNLSEFPLFSYIYWVRLSFFNIFFESIPSVQHPLSIASGRVRHSLPSG